MRLEEASPARIDDGVDAIDVNKHHRPAPSKIDCCGSAEMYVTSILTTYRVKETDLTSNEPALIVGDRYGDLSFGEVVSLEASTSDVRLTLERARQGRLTNLASYIPVGLMPDATG